MAVFGVSLLKKMEKKAASDERFTNNHAFRDRLLQHSDHLQKCGVHVLGRMSVASEKSTLFKDLKPDRYILLHDPQILGGGRTPLTMTQNNQLMEMASSASVQSLTTDVWRGRRYLTCSPRTKMITNALGNVFMLLLFSYLLLFDFRPRTLSYIEYIVFGWYFFYCIEELKQIWRSTSQSKKPCCAQL